MVNNQDFLRILFDISRSLNNIERNTVNTDKKVTQIHTMVSAHKNFAISPVLRRSRRLQAKKK